MKSLKYIVAGTMVGGAFGAKIGQYAASIINYPDAFQLMESSLLAGLMSGLVVSVAISMAMAVNAKEKEYRYVNSQAGMTVNGL